jgi:hypothetical protein
MMIGGSNPHERSLAMPLIGYSTNEEHAAVVAHWHCNDNPNMNSKKMSKTSKYRKEIFDIKRKRLNGTCSFLPICID